MIRCKKTLKWPVHENEWKKCCTWEQVPNFLWRQKMAILENACGKKAPLILYFFPLEEGIFFSLLIISFYKISFFCMFCFTRHFSARHFSARFFVVVLQKMFPIMCGKRWPFGHVKIKYLGCCWFQEVSLAIFNLLFSYV